MGLEIDGLTLWQATESTDAVDANLDVTSPPGIDSDLALLVTLEAVETMTLTGEATGIRLTGESGYSSDPQTALGQWVVQFDTLVSGNQGSGWSITDDQRSRTLTVTATDSSWQFSYGTPVSARWSLSVTRGEGVMLSKARSPASPGDVSATANNSATVDGNDLGSVTEKRTQKQIQVQPELMSFQGPGATVITPESGAVRQFTITGTKTDTDANLRTFDSNLRDLNGGNQSATYQTGFPGTSHTVVVDDYDSTYNAGETATLDYGLTLVEGLVL